MNPSSSAPSSLVPFSSCKRPKNDVFVNYSFEDTGNKFVSHLKVTLQRNCFTICDHTMLPIGQDESFELLKAIQESHIYVVVISMNYSRSINCLDELVLILDSLHKFKNRKFFPIFFNIDPSDVRHLRGSFEEAFRTHEAKVDPDRLHKWKQALEDAGQRSGLPFRNGDEADFVQEIVQRLRKIQLPVELFDVEHPVGIEPRVQAIISELRLGDPDSSNIVAVLGISGSGKTAIVKAVYDRIVPYFNFSCFIEDIRYYKNNGPNWKIELQRNVFHRLTGNDPFHNVEAPQIKKFISSNKALLVLDDVEEFEELQALAIPSASLGCGSRIIVNTINKRSLGNLQYTSYDIRLLNTEESCQLFVGHAYGEGDPVDMKFVLEIVSHAGGLPLVLEVWGRLFDYHGRRLWGSLFEKLKRIPDGNIQKKLQMSYDSLTLRVKNLFLDIACFFDGWFTSNLFEVLEDQESPFFPEIEIQPLVDRGLVRIDEHKQVVLHQVIRKMGEEVVRQENEYEPGQRTRLVDHRDVLRVLKEYSGTDSVISIMLDTSKLETKQYIQVEAFIKMRNLRFIKLVGGGTCYSSTNDDTPLSFKHLKYLEWEGFPCRRINNDMGNLVVIKLQRSKLEILWEGFKNLKNLRTLDVSFSNSLTRTGSFIGLENLEVLDLNRCKYLEEVDSSIGCLQELDSLFLSGCIRLKRFPCEVGSLKSLHQLHFSHCDNIQSIPNLPPSIKDIRGNDCRSLVNLPSNMSELQSLRMLVLDNCVKLESESLMKVTGLRNLKILMMKNCNVSQVSSEFGNLVSLFSLNLSENMFITSLPDSFSNLSELLHLKIKGCSNLQYLPLLPSNLVSIKASSCWSLNVMPFNSMQTAYIFRSKMFQESLFITPFMIELSGKELPDWFSTIYKEKGNVFSFVAPNHLDKRICGAILGATSDFNSFWDQQQQQQQNPIPNLQGRRSFWDLPRMHNKTKETSHKFNKYFQAFQSSMLVMFYPLNDTTLVVEAGDTVELQFSGDNSSGCGLSWIYEGDVVDSALLIQKRSDTDEHTSPVPSEMNAAASITQLTDEVRSFSGQDDI